MLCRQIISRRKTNTLSILSRAPKVRRNVVLKSASSYSGPINNNSNKAALSTLSESFNANDSQQESLTSKFPMLMVGATALLSGFLTDGNGDGRSNTTQCAALLSPVPVGMGSGTEFDKVESSDEVQLPVYTR